MGVPISEETQPKRVSSRGRRYEGSLQSVSLEDVKTVATAVVSRLNRQRNRTFASLSLAATDAGVDTRAHPRRVMSPVFFCFTD